MCGRFALVADGETIAEAFALAEAPKIAPRYNIAPTQPVAAVRPTPDGGRELTHFRWGLIPSWARDMKMGARMINARSETVAEKPSFRAAFRRRRCLIPATGFYEWQRQGQSKQPMFVRSADSELLALAGLWEIWHGPDGNALESCTILTTTPNATMTPIHNRMPVIVEPADFGLWLNPGDDPEQGLHLLRPYVDDGLFAYPVSKLVNSPRNDDPACIAPLA